MAVILLMISEQVKFHFNSVSKWTVVFAVGVDILGDAEVGGPGEGSVGGFDGVRDGLFEGDEVVLDVDTVGP